MFKNAKMRYTKYLGVLVVLFCFMTNAYTQESLKPIKVYKDFDLFEKEVLDKTNETPTLINFWATWCVPCMEEMPLLLEAFRDAKYDHVNFVFVSMDFQKDIESKLREYITKENIISNTVVLAAPKSNQWINQVSEEWTGALPFTMIINQSKGVTHEGKLKSMQQLKEMFKKAGLE